MKEPYKLTSRLLKMICIVVGLAMPIETLWAVPVSCNANPDNISGIIQYNTSGTTNTYCELCGVGQVHIIVTNPTNKDMANFVIEHVFDSNELEYVPGSTNGGADGDPTITGGGTVLTWTQAQIATLAQINGVNNTNYNTVDIIFNVRSRSNTEENLVNIDRDIRVTADYNLCPNTTNKPGSVSYGKIQLPIHEPIPTVDKLGRNYDAAQGAGSYDANVYGNINDDVIWRIRIINSGSADLEDLKFDDLMQDNNFQINYACPTEGEADNIAAANGANLADNCLDSSDSIGNSLPDFAVDDPFGNPANDEPGAYVDVPGNNGVTDIFLVGKITSSCIINKTNIVSNVEWGCEVDSPDGGITQTSTNASAGTSTGVLSSQVISSGLQITRALTGLNTGQSIGSRGLMTITVRNLSGGSVKNVILNNKLPNEYVVDSTFTPTLTMTYAYGNYDGRIDGMTVQMDDGIGNIVAAPPANPLDYKQPVFSLTSSTVNADNADQLNMMRHGDVAVIRFRVVMIQTDHFDTVANLDTTPEIIGGDDPDNVHNTATTDQVSNTLAVTYNQFCDNTLESVVYNDLFDADPEDLDISIPAAAVFILTNDPTQNLPLRVDVTNNGDADADNYEVYATFGATMEVVTVPNNCALTSNPPTLEVWDDPVDIPLASDFAAVYLCDRGTIGPGATESFIFEVVKVQLSDTNGALRLAEDDLTFRADVVGEIVLSDNTLTGSGALTPFSSGGALLDFPTVSTTGNGGQIDNRANNYSLDAVRAKVIGFNLSKTQVGYCSENNSPLPALPDNLVQIGEECKIHVETGGWFGFQTPGFTYIAVQKIRVEDRLPNGQGYISTSVPSPASTSMVKSIVLDHNSPPLTPLKEGTFNWTFNQNTTTERITEKDHWFRMDATTRILNDPIDSRSPPNVQAATSSNVLVSTFQAVFNDVVLGDVEYDLDDNTIGYPDAAGRTVDLTVTEPLITVDKRVCNESINGTGIGCTGFAPSINGGDTEDLYIYRVTLTNQAIGSSVARAPAYNITATDILDPSDLMYVMPFASDGLDNDGDGDIDGADLDGEGSISENVVYDIGPPVVNATKDPAVLTFSHTNSDALLKLDPGASVTFYYRINPDDAVAPAQILTNTVSATYDSLDGQSGNQTEYVGPPPLIESTTSEAGGARFYTSSTDSASVEMLSIQTFDKKIALLSNRIASGTPQDISVGEEIEYELKAWIPASNLEAFEIHDTLPAGISCSEAPIINLDAGIYAAAGFFPGGSWTPTCNDNQVSWYFGPQELTANLPSNQFEFIATFITRVDNVANVNDADIISNGAPATTTYLRYENELGAQVTLNFGQVDVRVREPNIVLTKSFEAGTKDADDIITVTVTATNNGTANAYNLRVLDDLDAVSNLTFDGNVLGTGPPTVDPVLGANKPIFKWAPADANYEIEVNETITFTFDVKVGIDAEPLEVLDNTIQASWQSLPSQDTALNTPDLIGADGSISGMRNGALPNAGDAINDYETTAYTSTTVQPVTIAKSDLDNTQPVEIGVHKNYEIIIYFPEGTTKNVVINDNLNFSGLTYFLENNATYDITYTFNELASVNGDATPDETSLIAFPADGATGTVNWNFGTVITNAEDDTTGVPAKSPSITINYYARINNDINTDRLDTLQNQVIVNYTNGETPATTEVLTDTTPPLTVVEAILGVTKVATLITAAPITGGDIIEYVVTITNSGDAIAYDVNIVDTLPSNLGLLPPADFTPSAKINGLDVGGFITAPANSPNGPLIWGRGNADNNLDIPAVVGNPLVLTYRVIVESGSESNLTYTNSVLIDWTSLNDTIANSATYERTGTGCPTTIAPNDYCVGPILETIATVDVSTLDKTVTTDTYGAPIGTVRVGDIITYQLSLNLQEGTTRNVNVEDVVPAGLSLVDIVSINGDTTIDYASPGAGSGSNFSYTDLGALSVPADGATGTLNFNFGTVINDPTGDATTDTITIIYRAKVDTDTLAQIPTTTLTNTATLQYIDGNGIAVVDNARLQKTYDVTLLQPVMTVPTKVDTNAPTSFVSIANVQVGVDTMQFRLESCNTTGLAPAYNVQITDQLPTQLDNTTLTVPVVNMNGALANDGVDYNYTAPPAGVAGRGGSLLFELIDPIDPGECVTIDYNIGIYADFPVNQTWYNSVTVDEYWSLPNKAGQKYALLGPTTFGMFNPSPFLPPTKILFSPGVGEATIGDEVVYQILIPTSNGVRHDLVITDTLNSSLEFIDATVSGGFTLINNTVAQPNLIFAIDTIPANQSATISVRARVVNSATVNAGDSFTNTAQYTYSDTPGGATLNGGAATTVTPLRIIEPLLALVKTVANDTNAGQPPVAGDILKYTLTFTASGGAGNDIYSNAFDVSIDDTLSLGLAYQTTTSTVDLGNTITDPTIVGDGINAGQSLSWNLTDATANIDVDEGTVVTVMYDVLVLDTVLAAQDLTNSAVIQWTGIDDASVYERNGTASPVYNDYFTGPATTTITTADNTNVTKTRLTDTYGIGDANVRIGDVVEFELRLALQEGLHNNLELIDSLPQGLAFESIVSVNLDTSSPYNAVAPFVHNDITPVTNGNPIIEASTLIFTIGDLTNVADGSNLNDEFVIIYRARVLDNVFTQVNPTTLTNTAVLNYTTAAGAQTDNSAVVLNLQQPILTVSKTAITAGGDTVLVADELVTYTLDVINGGTAPAYDVVVEDIIPVGMRLGTATITMVSTTLQPSGTVLTTLAPSYNATTGVATWNYDTGTADEYTIPVGERLRIEYRVQTDSDIGAGQTLTNQARATLYYSFDDDDVPVIGAITGIREIYGPTVAASVTLTTASPGVLLKENPVTTEVTIGETFTYRITVPQVAVDTWLHDVRIVDNLSATADLTYISVTKISAGGTWVPANTGTATNLVIEDATNGIDIAPNTQAIIDVTVVVNDVPANVKTRTFTNTATYTYNQTANDNATQVNGMSGTTANMTIVEPDNLTLLKTGPGSINIGTAETFTLKIKNTGDSPAYDVTVMDILPTFDPAAGGMCDTAPVNVVAQMYDAAGTAPIAAALTVGVDYTASYSGCTLTVTMTNAPIVDDTHLVITYEAELDSDTPHGSALTNYAWVSQWFSLDTAGAGATGEIRTYTEVLSAFPNEGTTGTLDHEDAYTVTSDTPTVTITKNVYNVTQSQSGVTANPGDTLRYSIDITNTSAVELYGFEFTDDLDALNTTPMFVAGTLNVTTLPVGADNINTSDTGGTKATGLVDIRSLTLGAAASGSESILIEFEVQLVPSIQSATVVLNQGVMTSNGLIFLTDDPNVGGATDPTETLISSAPLFEVKKISTDLTGDPAILESGDTLRYTITVKNIGTEDAINTYIQDQLPANTTYVAGTTTLNGISVTEPIVGTLPLITGITINAPEDLTAGNMRADATATTANVATITFNVTINAGVFNGTVISNQAYVTADSPVNGAIAQQPSDDPGTPLVADDPTRDIIGNQPLLDAQKTVSILVDNGTIGVLDPNDIIRYTITITNSGAANATGVYFKDTVPANTQYLGNAVTLNGVLVADPALNVSPLIAGIPIYSTDQILPAGSGVVSIGQSAVITYDVQVLAGAATGDIISNQGFVESIEQLTEPTDQDGIDSNGDQPTVIAVGNAQTLSITKSVSVVGGGPAEAGGQLEYRVLVTNVSPLTATNVVIYDNLDDPVAGQVTYVAGSGLLDGLPTGVSYSAPTLTADYNIRHAVDVPPVVDLAPGQTTELVFRVLISSDDVVVVPLGTVVENRAIVYWDAATKNATATVSITIGESIGVANLYGSIWHDVDFDNIYNNADTKLQNWNIDIYQGGTLKGTTVSDSTGNYQFTGVIANDGTGDVAYELRFRSPGSTSITAQLGIADSAFTDDLHNISNIYVSESNVYQNLNLPIDPNGVVYDSVTRTAISAATISLLNSATGLPVSSNCFDDVNQQNQVTTANGYYKFDLNFTQGDCSSGDNYIVKIAAPSGYSLLPSSVIPPQTNAATAAYNVPTCIGDTVPTPVGYCEVQTSGLAPVLAVPAASVGTYYHLHLTLNNTSIPGSSQLFNNHLPIDPILTGAVAVTKTTPLVNVTRSQLVPYTITLTNNYSLDFAAANIVDSFPAGFKYVKGSARYDGVAEEPVRSGLNLIWANKPLIKDETHKIKLLLIVGAAANEGEFINKANVIDTVTGFDASNVAEASVRVIPDPAFDCSDIIGKVYDDKNLNGYQDENEKGIAGARVVTVKGLEITSDKHGRFHLTCAVVPDESRGSNFIMKLDDRSLPSGYRLTTENPRVQRATRGKMLKFNFGATIHRVVSMDVADAVFENGNDNIHSQWLPRLDLLIEQLKEKPSILRLSYLADIEDSGLVDDRLQRVQDEINQRWKKVKSYDLTIEAKVFWRRGGPANFGDLD